MDALVLSPVLLLTLVIKIFQQSTRQEQRQQETEKEIITYHRITYLEDKLPNEQFLRIHRSYIIAIDKIMAFTSTSIETANQELPVGRLYKTDVMRAPGLDNAV